MMKTYRAAVVGCGLRAPDHIDAYQFILEKNARTRFAVCHQVRWQPYLRKCREALLGGALGKLL
jgi:hypothetical protein